MNLKRDRPAARSARQVERDRAALGELDRVVGQIQEYLLHAQRVAAHVPWRIRCHIQLPVEALVACQRRGNRGRLADQHVQIERQVLEFELAGFDAREVERVVDQA